MTAVEGILERASKSEKVGNWFALLLPLIMEAIQLFMEQCQETQAGFVAACANPSAAHENRLRRHIGNLLWDVRREHGWGLLQTMLMSFAAKDAIIEEVKATAKRSAGDGELSQAWEELKTAA